jgi:adenine-specific DNA-methyltransferase
LKIEPKEADRLPVPSAEVLTQAGPALRALRPQLAKHLRSADLGKAVEWVDCVLLIEQLGLKRAEVGRLREAREMLFGRRLTRGSK